MLKPLVTMTLIAANLAFAPVALAQTATGSPDRPMMRGDHPMMLGDGPRRDGARAQKRFHAMWKELGLTAEQKKKMEALHKQDLPKMQDRYKTMWTEHQAMLDLMASPSADDAALRAQFEKIKEAKRQAEAVHLDYMLAMRLILTAEQRKKFYSNRRAMGMMGGMMGPGSGMMGVGESWTDLDKK